jgi:protein TonB
MAASVVIHGVVIGLLIFVPLYFAKDVIIPKKLVEPTYIFTPPPPPAPPPPAGAAQAPKTLVQTPKIVEPTPLVAPKVVPKTAPQTAENATAAPDLGDAGVPGGVLGGVIGGTGTVPGPPAPPKNPAVVRVGGNVKAPELVQKVEPQYPTVARMAHVQGTVVIDAVISKDGAVISAHAVSGPGLLIPSALDAVKQWKYKPTYLNGQPVDLAMQVTVNFQTGGGQG